MRVREESQVSLADAAQFTGPTEGKGFGAAYPSTEVGEGGAVAAPDTSQSTGPTEGKGFGAAYPSTEVGEGGAVAAPDTSGDLVEEFAPEKGVGGGSQLTGWLLDFPGDEHFVQQQSPENVVYHRPLGDNPSAVFPNSESGFPPSSGKKSEAEGTGEIGSGFCLRSLGGQVLHRFLEVLPLRSQPTGTGALGDFFPVPTSKEILQDLFPDLNPEESCWFVAVCLGLNSVWGGPLFNDSPPSPVQSCCLKELFKDVSRLKSMTETLTDFNWTSFFRTRSVDYRGDEIKIALRFGWSNISPALPREIGVVPLEEICCEGAQFYVKNFDLFLKRPEEWPKLSAPKVMVCDEDWGEVCTGLTQAGVCTYLEREEVFGLFGVTKDEWVDGVEVFRLIMNLIPLNNICQPLAGDVATLPSWSSMSPFFLQPTESLLVSSEDVRCFFYVMSVPTCWHKYLAFNKVVPEHCLPDHLKGREVYLAAKVFAHGISEFRVTGSACAPCFGTKECKSRTVG